MTRLNSSQIHSPNHPARRGTVLIVVLWLTLTLVSVGLVFAESMRLEYRAAENSMAGLNSMHTIEGARRYLTYFLENLETPGTIPDTDDYEAEQVRIGDSYFWLMGRGTESDTIGDKEPVYALLDESSKINLNTATAEILEALPGMTAALAGAIIDWRDTDSDVTDSGAESETYLRHTPKYNCKNSSFETVEELRLVYGMIGDLLYGEDTNYNGILDPNEDDGDESLPNDNKNGTLDCGLLEYVTVYSHEPNTDSDGEERINVASTSSSSKLTSLLEETLGSERAAQIKTVSNPKSVLEYYVKSGLTADEFEQLADSLTASDESTVQGLINVNTASETVLECIPGIGQQYASAIISAREGKDEDSESFAWLTEVLDETSATEAGPYLTWRAYQFSADIVAVGPNGRGFRREVLVIDTSGDSPIVVYRRDRTRLGWPLTTDLRKQLLQGTLTQNERDFS